MPRENARVIIDLNKSLYVQIAHIRVAVQAAKNNNEVIQLISIRDEKALAENKTAKINDAKIRALMRVLKIDQYIEQGSLAKPKQKVKFTLELVNKQVGNLNFGSRALDEPIKVATGFWVASIVVGIIIGASFGLVFAGLIGFGAVVVIGAAIAIGVYFVQRRNERRLVEQEAQVKYIENVIEREFMRREAINELVEDYKKAADAFSNRVETFEANFGEYLNEKIERPQLNVDAVVNDVLAAMETYTEVSQAGMSREVMNKIPSNIKSIREGKADQELNAIKQDTIKKYIHDKFAILYQALTTSNLSVSAQQKLQELFTKKKNDLLTHLNCEGNSENTAGQQKIENSTAAQLLQIITSALDECRKLQEHEMAIVPYKNEQPIAQLDVRPFLLSSALLAYVLSNTKAREITSAAEGKTPTVPCSPGLHGPVMVASPNAHRIFIAPTIIKNQSSEKNESQDDLGNKPSSNSY